LPATDMPIRPPALSVRRPWPWLMLHAGKDTENRLWTTAYRGLLLIHASGGWDGRGIPFAGELAARGVPGIPLHRLAGDHDLHPVGIVGAVELYDICTDARHGGTCDCPPWAAAKHNHFRLRNPVAFPRPVTHRGFLNLWQVTDRAWPAVETQLKEVGHLV
jgi:hypothetical protein